MSSRNLAVVEDGYFYMNLADTAVLNYETPEASQVEGAFAAIGAADDGGLVHAPSVTYTFAEQDGDPVCL